MDSVKSAGRLDSMLHRGLGFGLGIRLRDDFVNDDASGVLGRVTRQSRVGTASSSCSLSECAECAELAKDRHYLALNMMISIQGTRHGDVSMS